MMDTYTLLDICKRDCAIEKMFVGVLPSNKLPKKTSRPCCLIANTKPETHTGEHWIGIFINKEGYGDYFCSFGVSPQTVFAQFMETHCGKWNYSTKQIQQPFSITCGQYALFFLHARANGLPMHKFLDLFTNNHEENDEIVAAFINGLYNVDTKIYT